MANFLADIGRSNMLESVTGTISAINSMRQTDATVALGKEQIERVQRQNLAEKQEYEEGEREIALETIDVLGGPDGKIAQDVLKLAKRHGFINTDAGGMGSIKAKYLPVMKNLMSEPRYASQLSLDTITHRRNELVQIKEQLEKKPEDQNLLQAKQKITTALNMAVGQNANLQTELKRQAAEEAAKTELGEKPKYQMVGGNLWKVGDGKPKQIIKGSIEDKAHYNAMHDPQRQWIEDESELYELVQMHLRILQNKPKKAAKKDYGTSNQPEGTMAANNKGVKIITKNGKWILQ